jgi:hypothetical protein
MVLLGWAYTSRTTLTRRPLGWRLGAPAVAPASALPRTIRSEPALHSARERGTLNSTTVQESSRERPAQPVGLCEKGDEQ